MPEVAHARAACLPPLLQQPRQSKEYALSRREVFSFSVARRLLERFLGTDVVIVSAATGRYSGAVHYKGQPIRHRWRAWGVLAVWCLTATAEPAEETALKGWVSEFVRRAWQVEDGLPQNSVMAILPSRDGYLWLGTANGLARFDGVRFKVFGLADGLPSLLVRVLLEDREGTIWIGTGSGLCRYREGRFTSWTTRDGLVGDGIMALAEDREAAIWVGTTSGLSRWRQGVFETVGAREGVSGRYVRALLADRRGGVWVAITGVGLVRWDGRSPGTGVDAFKAPGVAPYSLLEDRAGRIWAGTVGSILRLEGDVWRSAAAGLPNVRVTALAEGADDTIWVGTLDEGLYSLRQGKAQRVTPADGLSDEAVQAVVEAAEKNLWVGTRAGGLNRLRARQVSMRSILDGGTEIAPMSLAESADGMLWVASLGRGLYRFDAAMGGQFVREPLAHYLPFGAMLVSRDGSLWWGTVSRLSRWKNGTLIASYDNEEWLRSDAVRCLCEDRNEGLWIGTRDGKLQFLRDGTFAAFTNDLPRAALTTLVQQRDGTLWIGTYGGGLRRLKGGACTTFGKQHGLRSDLIRALFLDSGEHLWIGTEGGGVSCFKDGQIRGFSAQQGMGDDTTVQILEDNARDLWLGTYHGIFRIIRQELDDLLAGRVSHVHPRAFGRADGMRSEQCAVGFGTCLKTRSGLLCFSTDKGIAIIDPRKGKDGTPPPRIVLEDVLVDGSSQLFRRNAANSVGSQSTPIIPPGKPRIEFRVHVSLFFRSRARTLPLPVGGARFRLD